MGHEVRLIPPAYVKPFVKRNKNDAIDAEAICEAAQRPGMRFVAVKTEEQQAAGLVFRTRDFVVRQRTQLINAIRGHLAEYGWVAPRGTANMTLLASLIDEEEMASTLPAAALPMFKLMLDLLAELDKPPPAPSVINTRHEKPAPDEIVIAFPSSGHIAHTAFGAIARANLPSPQRDHGMVADDFRAFMRQRDIAFDAKNITQIFATFCSKQRAAN